MNEKLKANIKFLREFCGWGDKEIGAYIKYKIEKGDA
jgi:hypothetical protein